MVITDRDKYNVSKYLPGGIPGWPCAYSGTPLGKFKVVALQLHKVL